MKFIDWFAGIGGFRRGMELAGHECVGFCEFDKFATASYISMHLLTDEQRKALEKLPLKKRQKEILKDEYRNGEWYANDIRRVCADDIPKADCWCFGFPCQDISVAGKQLGFRGNRSSLFFRVMYLIGQLKEEDKPTYLFIENVKNLLRSVGVVCNVNPSGKGMNGNVYDSDGLSPTLTTNKGEGNKIAIPVLTPDRAEKRQNGRRFKEDGEPMFTLTGQDRHGVGIEPLGALRNVRSDYGKEIRKDYEAGNIKISRHEFLESEVRDDGVVNTLLTVQKDNQLAVKVAEATKQGYSECRVGVDSVNLSVPGSKTRRGRAGQEIANTLDTSCNQGIFVQVSEELTVYAVWYEKYQCYIAIRRLTPKECFRLQGWTDDYFEKAQFVNSDSQLYKQAGNGVTVNVIEAIAEKLRFA